MPAEKRCEWCKRVWRPSRPKARTCSPSCRASLVASEKQAARQLSARSMPGWEFLDDDDFVTTEELASVVGVVRPTVAVWVRTGRLPAEPVPSRGGRGGKQWRIRVRDARKFLAARGDGSGSPTEQDPNPTHKEINSGEV